MSCTWSTKELEQLKELYSRADLTVDEIAVMMNKSLSSVTSQAKRKKIKKARVIKLKNDKRESCNRLSRTERNQIIIRISYNLLGYLQ